MLATSDFLQPTVSPPYKIEVWDGSVAIDLELIFYWYSVQRNKIRKVVKMRKKDRIKCHGIIHTAAVGAAAAGAGLAQIPGSDNSVIVPIQITMIISLGSVFGIELTESAAKATLATTTATLIGRGLSQVLIGWLPGIGNAINASTAGSITEMIGWAVAKNYAKDSDKNLEKDLDSDRE